MQKYFYALVYILLTVVFVAGCDTTNSDDTDEITASEEKQFVWNGLNHWYFWQGDVPDLADSKIEDKASFSDLLNSFDDEEALFDNLIFREQDDFSWFIPDYEVHEAAQVGTSTSFGFRFQPVQLSQQSNVLFGLILYVVPGGPADNAGIERGDIFGKVSGTQLTINNYQELLGTNAYELEYAELIGNELSDTGETVSITAASVTENPIHTTEILDVGGTQVGYLLYNAFRYNFHEELNDVFSEFQSAGIDELVLDLRYNGGGAVLTSAILASMISGLDDNSVFADMTYNDRQASQNQLFPFFSQLPVYDDSGAFLGDDTPVTQLGMDRLYVLTSGSTASASEALINGLTPYGVEVILIGETTTGKDEGSITVYDVPEADYSPSGEADRERINPNHKRAMQPIVFKIFNRDMQAYPDGFPPHYQARELSMAENLPPLGDPDEPLLSVALEHIQTGAMPAIRHKADDTGKLRFKSNEELANPFYDDMYLLPGEMSGRQTFQKQE